MTTRSIIRSIIIVPYRRLGSDQNGATAIEYALIAALISLAIISALGTLGSQMADIYVRIVGAMP